jgi:hypothetical protein
LNRRWLRFEWDAWGRRKHGAFARQLDALQHYHSDFSLRAFTNPHGVIAVRNASADRVPVAAGGELVDARWRVVNLDEDVVVRRRGIAQWLVI